MRITLLLILMIFVREAHLQEPTWHVDFWDRTSGLKSNMVYDVIEDLNGVIWVGSEDGVYRMDGYTMTPLTEITQDPDLPLKFSARALYVDDQNRLWIGGFRTGLYCYDQAMGDFWHVQNRTVDNYQIPGTRVYGMHQDAEGHLMISMHQVGFGRYYEEKDSFELIRPFTDQVKLREERNFQLMLIPVKDFYSQPVMYWYTTLTSLVHYDKRRDTFLYHNPPLGPDDIGIRSATMDHEGIIWMSTYSKGNWSYNTHTEEWNNYRVEEGPDSYHNALNSADIQVLNSHSILMASSRGGLFLLDRDSGIFTPVNLSVEKGGNKKKVFHLYRDSRENLWISTYSGLLCYTPSKQQFGRVNRSGYFQDAYRDTQSDALLLVDYYNELHVLNAGGRDFVLDVPKTEGYDDGLVGICSDSKSQLWLVEDYGVRRYFPQPGLPGKLDDTYTYQIPYQLGYIRKFQLDHDDVLWLGTQPGVVISIDLNSGKFNVYDSDGPANLEYAYSTACHFVDHKGNIWFTGSGGIFYFDKQKGIFSNSPEIFMSESGSVVVHSFALTPSERENRVYGGFKLNTIYSVPTAQLENAVARMDSQSFEMPPYDLNDMEFDQQGRLWFAMDEGVAYRDLDGDYHFLGEADGITSVNAFKPDRDGYLLALADGGYYRFHPDSIREEENPYNIQLRQFSVFDELYLDKSGRPVGKGETAQLTHRENFFSFTFDDASFRSKKKKLYAYMLEGIDEAWIESGVRNYAAYTNIPSGTYTFLVKAKVQDSGSWSESEELLMIKILPPWWATWWFIVAMVVATGSIIYLFYRYRISQFRTKQNLIIAFNKQLAETELKALRAQMNPHFLFNVLNAIKLNVQKNQQDNAIDFITDFSKLIRSVLQNSGKKRITLGEELEALELYIKIEQKRFTTEFEYKIELDGVNPSAIMIPPLLLQPYVENAIWHGLMHKTKGVGRLTVYAGMNGRGVVIRIRDNGIGREQAERLKSKSAVKRKSMGMQITSKRMQLAEQDITVELIDLYDDERAAGTEVVVRLGRE